MTVAALSFAAWLYLLLLHGRFWSSGPELTAAPPSPTEPEGHPAVDVLVPARDEAATIGAAIRSLLDQDYPGNFRITLIDDDSGDGTATLAGSAPNLHVLRLHSKPTAWSGKLWALNQGLAATEAPLVLFTDADIVHDPRHLSALVAKLSDARLGMVSEMVRLNCESPAERALVPAFVYFFQMLYPFAEVNDARSQRAAAAGGTILVRRELLRRIGGLDAIRSALIDDVALAKVAKKCDAIFLGHSALARSIRPYPRFADLWDMIARTAFTQLNFSVILLALTLAGLVLVWWVPLGFLLLGNGWTRALGGGGFLLAALSYQPTLTRYRRGRLWALALPLIAAFYMAATVGSAVNHWRGKGATWKSRSYEQDGRGTPRAD